MKVFKGSFSANTTTGNQTVSGIQDDLGVPFTPKAIIIWTSYQTAAGFSDGYQYQIGLCDGTNQNSWAVIADDNTSPNDTDRCKTESHLVEIHSVAGTDIRVGDIVSFGSGQFVINWTTADATAAIFHFMAFGGSDLSAAVQTDTMVSNLNTVPDFSDVTFGISLIFYVLCVPNGDAGNGPTFGWAAVANGQTITQGTACAQVRDAQTTSITGRYQRPGRCATIMNSTTQTSAGDLAFRSLGLYTVVNLTASTIHAHFLALGGFAAKAGDGLQPTGTGNQSITGVGFKPKGVMMMSVGQTAQTTVQTEARFSLGGADGTNQGWAWCGAANGVNPSRVAGGDSVSNIVTMSTPTATGSSSTTEAQASLQSLEVDGFTLNWGTADATQREYLWCAFGDSDSVLPPAAPATKLSLLRNRRSHLIKL